ncbi:MAG: type II toxin-antitoxin system prevent-host-death family antitoxin [Chloroflexia bacterium]|nr:type II toxin-antitoxin system prevent-host-death family antitoxin [Chloroflexia bacterium]
MQQASVREVRDNLRAYLDRAEAGEEIVVMRRGKEVARIVPPRREPKRFPDLTEFRKSIKLRGDSPLETVLKMREETRY